MRKKTLGFGVIEIILAVVVVGLLVFTGWYVLKNNDDTKTTPVAEENTIKYTNEELGFSFVYPDKYGGIVTTESYGGESKEGRSMSIAFTTLCDGCTPGETNVFAISPTSPGLIEIAATNPKYGGVGTDRPLAMSAGYTTNSDGSITFKGFAPERPPKNNYPAFKAQNTDGLLVQHGYGEDLGLRTSIIFNLNHDEYTGIEFMTHDEPGETTNADNMKEIVKTFRLLN